MDEGYKELPYKEFLSAIINGNYKESSEIVLRKYDEGLDLITIYEGIIRKALYEVGNLWEYNRISVATEHMASAISEKVINEVYMKTPSGRSVNRKAIISCIENEAHLIGARMINDIFELNGWDTYFLGANTPAGELIRFSKAAHPHIIAISVSIYFHIPSLIKLIDLIRTELPDIRIVIGGQAFRNGREDILKPYANVLFFPDLPSVDNYLKTLANE